MVVIVGTWGFNIALGHIPLCHVTLTGASGGNLNRCNRLSLFANANGHMTLICPSARRLGAAMPLTILWFAPLARLCPVLGFHA